MIGQLARLEGLARFSFALVAAGYIALRVHNNHLGIPMRVEPGGQVYLAESAVFAIALLISLVAISAAVFPVALAAIIASTWSGRFRAWTSRMSGRVRRARASPLLPGLSFFLIMAALLALLAQVGSEADLVVGKLNAQTLAQRPPVWLFHLGVLLALVGALVAAAEPAAAQPAAPAGWMWQLHRLAALLAVAALPLLFGQFAHPYGYPVARVTEIGAGQSPASCGLLIGRSGSDIVLWSVVGDAGVFSTFPAEKRKLETGPLLDIRSRALFALQGPRGSDCSTWFPAGP